MIFSWETKIGVAAAFCVQNSYISIGFRKKEKRNFALKRQYKGRRAKMADVGGRL